MNEAIEKINEIRLSKTVKSLEGKGFEVFVTDDEQQALQTVLGLIKPKSSVNVGGSISLHEIGLIDQLRTRDYEFQDRYKEGVDKEVIYRQAFSCDTYIASTNAITEDGQLYNIDGHGNRVAAMVFGPQQVILVVGIQKIVKDVNEAQARLRCIAAPANCERLEKNTPCRITGECVDCLSDDTICTTTVITRRCNVKGRIKIVFVKKNIGF